MSRRLLLVRHGQSTWNAEDRLQGQADPPLSELGRAEAVALRPALRALAPHVVLTSDLARARETAALLGHSTAPADPRWREFDLGDWTSRTENDVRAESDGAFAAWRAGRANPPGGESWATFGDRILEAVQALPPVERALIVTHGGPIRTLCARLLDTEVDALTRVTNASLTVLELADRPRLLRYNWTMS